MSAHRLYLLEAAREELREAVEWYATRSQRAAATFLREVDRATGLIAESPDLWPRFDGEVQRYVLRSYPYSLLYRKVGTAIEIIAVAHHKRRPGYWRGRPDA
jgi:plasmid stabilization system protein ParE